MERCLAISETAREKGREMAVRRRQVRIQGLVSKPQFNGKLATVLGPQGGERVQVRMADGTEIALKPSNLEAFVAEANSANLDSA